MPFHLPEKISMMVVNVNVHFVVDTHSSVKSCDMIQLCPVSFEALQSPLVLTSMAHLQGTPITDPKSLYYVSKPPTYTIWTALT